MHLYWHPTNERGEIELPPPEKPKKPDRPMTLQEELRGLVELANFFRISDQERASLEEQLRAKYAAKEGANGA